MLRIALVNPAQPDSYPQPPMGLAQLAAVLEKNGHYVSIIDANVLRLPPEEILPLAADADVVGLTAMTPTISAALDIARHLKQENPDRRIILGGTHATLLPEETIKACPEIDIVVRGEGEENTLELLSALEENGSLADIHSVTYRRDGKIMSTPAVASTVDVDSLPFLAYHLLPWREYKPHPPHGRALPFAAIITSRGCPYNCSYCSKPVFGRQFRGQSPARVVDEIEYLVKDFGIREMAFYDDVFTLDKKRAYEIADEIIKRGVEIQWTCESRVNLIDMELLWKMKQAGCYSIAYGIESGSQEILDVMDKGISLKQIDDAVRWTRQAGIQTIGYFMVGAPGETPETIQRTIDFAKELKLDFAQFSITTPFPGTKLYDLYRKGREEQEIHWESFVYAGSNHDTSPVFESSQLSREDIQNWARKAYREFYLNPSYPLRRLMKIRSFGDLRVNFRGMAMLMNSLVKK